MSYVSPQSTGAPTPHDVVSPQMTGITPAQPTENAPPHYNDEKIIYDPNQQQREMSQAEALPGQQPQFQQQQPQPQPQPQPSVPAPSQYLTATPLASLQQSPTPVDCPICRVRQMTRTEFVTGGTTHIASWFKDVEHKCGNCGALLAVYHRSGSTEVTAHPTRFTNTKVDPTGAGKESRLWWLGVDHRRCPPPIPIPVSDLDLRFLSRINHDPRYNGNLVRSHGRHDEHPRVLS
ncbi:hypothetical protein G7Y89_g14942 [Cudoniella acicularis]|uniref:LITAF domain-containing protein n=1 Tax=Cudoniella acicularis TaxID=354080 RepID=A0A8H4QW92_9HELO|nr:hypothetical protein G7Y89_g14942 [Cudoniella acicularis]